MNYFIDSQGNYLGAWDNGGPNDGIKVESPPDDARQVWDFDALSWSELKPEIPQSVPMRAARAAMIISGIDEQVEAAIDSIEDDIERKLARNDWEKAVNVERSSKLVASIGAAIGLSEEQIDDLFLLALTIPE